MKKEVTVIVKKTNEVIADFVVENLDEKIIVKNDYDVVVKDFEE